MPKNWRFKTENCDTSEIFKINKYPEIRKDNVKPRSLYGIKAAGRASMPVQRKISIHSLLNVQFLKNIPVPQFSLLNPKIFGTYLRTLTCSFHCDASRVLTSGFQSP